MKRSLGRSESGHGASSTLRLSRRRWLVAAGAAIGAAAWPGHARSGATGDARSPATPIAAGRDWRGEQWVGTWAGRAATPFPAFEDFPSQLFELDNQTVRQIVTHHCRRRQGARALDQRLWR